MIIRTKEDIDFLLEKKVKSGLELEYAKTDVLDIHSEKKHEKFSILVSSMANAKGGCILFGIDSFRNKPKTLQKINTTLYSYEWFNHAIQTFIKPDIPNSIISFIEYDDIHTIIAINIPDTSLAPFMALDKRFYKRIENKAFLMEEYEVRDMYNKSKKTELDLFGILNTGGVPVLDGGKFEKVTFYPRFLIKNISNVIEKNYKIELYLPSALQNANFDPLQQYFSRMEDEFSVFSVNGKHPLFQNELSTILEAQFIVDEPSFHAFEHGEIIIKIYFSNGVKSKAFNLRNTFLYKNKRLSRSDFAMPQHKLDFKFE